MKIGILGGTFNPIHNGHIQLAQYCKNEVSLDKIFLIPTYTPPHKISKDLANETHRLNMCSLASENLEGFEVCDIEIKRQGTSYTFETLNSLKEIYPDDELHLIMGADMFLTLDKWKNPESIFANAVIIAIPRNDSDKEELERYYNTVIKDMGAKAVILPNNVQTVSSTFIRENIGEYKTISDLIDKKVYEYIISNNLYRK